MHSSFFAPRRLRRATVAVLLATVDCGPGMLASMPDGDLFAEIRVKVDFSDLQNGEPPSRLTMGIAWGGPWESPAICYEALRDSVVQGACRSPYAFVPSRITPIVEDLERQEDGTFVLPISALPPPPAAVGTEGGWIAYGSVVVIKSRGRSGDIPYHDVRRWQFYASSVVNIFLHHTRVVARWGSFDEKSTFYPYPVSGCGPPPEGISLLTVSSANRALSLGDCTFSPAHTAPTVKLTPLSAADAFTLGCPAVLDPHAVLKPSTADANDLDITAVGNDEHTCLSANTVFVRRYGSPYGFGSTCPELKVWALKGCARNLLCDKGGWDERPSPPPEWPCSSG